jgi:hypothetical protein
MLGILTRSPHKWIPMTTRRSLFAITVLALLQGCNVVGPAAIRNGRSTYNAVINQTEDEQILAMIVHQRYDETFGMLAVSSVTANIKIGANVGGNAGVGASSSFEGNLVPISAGATYEENPTISYTPMRGEQFVERMLAPVSADQALLLSRMSTDEVEVLRLLVRRANGLVNPLYSSTPVAPVAADAPDHGDGFDQFIDLYAKLREHGKLDIVRSTPSSGPPSEARFEMLLHDYSAEDEHDIDQLLKLLGVQTGRSGREAITVPVRFFVGAHRADGVDLETPSAFEIIDAAAMGVDVPDSDVSEGIARSSAPTARHELIDIRCSRERPPAASVAVEHRGWWFYVDARDARSKQAFMILRTLIGMRLDQAGSSQQVPVLTVPVGG